MRNKWAWRNNFHTYHFKNSINLGLFLGLILLIQTDVLQWSIYCQVAEGGLLFCNSSDDPIKARLDALLGHQDASRLCLHSPTKKQDCWGDIWQIGQVADHLYPSTAIWSPGLWHRCGLRHCSVQDQSWVNNLVLFGLKIGLTRAFFL